MNVDVRFILEICDSGDVHADALHQAQDALKVSSARSCLCGRFTRPTGSKKSRENGIEGNRKNK